MASTSGPPSGFSALDLALSDARLAFNVVNHVRYEALERAFGVSREQANVLTFVLLVSAGDIAYEAGKKVLRVPPVKIGGSDAALGALAAREAALSAVGPGIREIPGLGTLLAIAFLGGVSLPAVRRAAHRLRVAEQRLRATEHRVRAQRIGRYVTAMRDRTPAT
jgi:hypothetical protein